MEWGGARGNDTNRSIDFVPSRTNPAFHIGFSWQSPGHVVLEYRDLFFQIWILVCPADCFKMKEPLPGFARRACFTQVV